MASSIHELLQPQVILDVISRIREGQGRLSKWFGFAPNRFDPETVSLDGPNIVKGDTRYASWRIYDHSRIVAKSRAPSTGPATVAANPIGDTRISCARFHEKIPMMYEDLGNLSPLAGPNSVVDPGGQDYIARQERTIAEHFNNAVELMTAGMIRGQFYLKNVGDNWIPVLANPSPTPAVTVNFQIPAGNKTQLDMLGDGNIINVSWANPAALIVKDLSQIKAAFARLTGYPLRHIWVTSPMWYQVITNAEVKNTAGSANVPFAEFDFVPETGFDGMQISDYSAILRADPTIIWHITDEVLVVDSDVDPSYSTGSGTYVKVIDDTAAMFSTDPSPLWCRMYHGSEYVVENPGQVGVKRTGYYFWHQYVTQPSAVELIGLANLLPLLYVPKAIAYGTVEF
jgi:hypothetical protein